MTPIFISLDDILEKQVNITGYNEGVKARNTFNLDALDADDTLVIILIPDRIQAISTSFFKGMFEKSVAAKQNQFLSKYLFKTNNNVMKQIVRNITRCIPVSQK